MSHTRVVVTQKLPQTHILPCPLQPLNPVACLLDRFVIYGQKTAIPHLSKFPQKLARRQCPHSSRCPNFFHNSPSSDPAIDCCGFVCAFSGTRTGHQHFGTANQRSCWPRSRWALQRINNQHRFSVYFGVDRGCCGGLLHRRCHRRICGVARHNGLHLGSAFA